MDEIGLGIESSCDESSAAVLRGNRVLSNIIHSQIEDHRPFRGVVPEIASRAHLEKINDCIEQALQQAAVSFDDLDFVAVTVQPGLVGSLMVGAQAAKAIALATGAELRPVDHLEAHIFSPVLEGWAPRFPFLALLLSGGNSAIFVVHGVGKLELIADTLDDACGEAFDKIAAIVNLPYPGGPAIERAAADYDRFAGAWRVENSLFSRLLRNQPASEIQFSFSGIKTAAMRAMAQGEVPGRICRDFQETAFHLVRRNLQRAVRKTGLSVIAASGGVLANGRLRQSLDEMGRADGLEIVYPTARYLCTDNAAMVALLGGMYGQIGLRSAGFDFSVSSKRDLIPGCYLGKVPAG
ncbi:MAG: tRNA (adenosine(37)-N6)-threonylcarbamoyltransferase complex transferase subunit TsaD [Leptospirales bacterium]|nr:tRNA (adenosine(37)-N6)-threonylcarbamoyltransferase complex transferase subunit TsaD [Leptospirales bacterium]